MPDDPKPERCVSCDICTKGTSFAGVHCRCGADLTHATHVWLDANGAPIRHSGVPYAQPEQAREERERVFAECPVCNRDVDKWRTRHFDRGKRCPGIPVLVTYVPRRP